MNANKRKYENYYSYGIINSEYCIYDDSGLYFHTSIKFLDGARLMLQKNCICVHLRSFAFSF